MRFQIGEETNPMHKATKPKEKRSEEAGRVCHEHEDAGTTAD